MSRWQRTYIYRDPMPVDFYGIISDSHTLTAFRQRIIIIIGVGIEYVREISFRVIGFDIISGGV